MGQGRRTRGLWLGRNNMSFVMGFILGVILFAIFSGDKNI